MDPEICLNCIKRMMYGRAKFDLLRQRVLYRGPSSQQLATTHPISRRVRMNMTKGPL